uniref:Capsular polysaccharide synthesis protein n=1 Tax=viral metagenome TaxID=1070528 RepID=A0A6C0I1I5_9ZZZZ
MKKKYLYLFGLIILIILLLIIYFCCTRAYASNLNSISEKFTQRQIEIKDNEPFDYTNYIFPKIIWVYWDSIKDIPLCIQNVWKNNYNIIKTWKVNFLSNDTLSQYIPNEAMPSFKKLVIAQKADWIRVYLLEHYGGCWCDAGIIINDENALTRMRDQSIKQQSLFTGFYFKTRTSDNNIFSFVENWFIMAPKFSTIIKLWRQEFEKAINMGFTNYRKKISKNKSLNLEKIFNQKYPRDTYLTQQACFYNISEDFSDELLNHMILYLAEDSMFKLQDGCGWDRKCIHKRLDSDLSVKKIPFIKLVTDDRKGFNLANYPP